MNHTISSTINSTASTVSQPSAPIQPLIAPIRSLRIATSLPPELVLLVLPEAEDPADVEDPVELAVPLEDELVDPVVDAPDDPDAPPEVDDPVVVAP